MRLFCEVEGGDADARWKLNRLALLQEGGWIARTWIVDSKIYPSIPMPQ